MMSSLLRFNFAIVIMFDRIPFFLLILCLSLMSLDASLDDWTEEDLLHEDPFDIGVVEDGLDFRRVYGKQVSGEVRFAIETAGPAQLSERVMIFLDTDGDPHTGYRVFDLGADMLIRGSHLFVHGEAANIYEWKWDYQEEVVEAINGSLMEIAIRSGMLPSATLNFVILGTNPQPGVMDLVPNTARNLQEGPAYLRIEHPTEFSVKLDGILEEWAAPQRVDPNETLAEPQQRIDIKSVQLEASEKNVYVAYDAYREIDLENDQYTLFFDTDQNPATGYAVYGHLGAEVVITNREIRRYQGSGSDWNWQWLGRVGYAVSDMSMEMVFPKKLLGSERFNVAFYGSGGGIDVFPDALEDEDWASAVLSFEREAELEINDEFREQISNEILASIPQNLNLAVFSLYRSTGDAVWADHWPKNIDMTGVAWDSARAVTLISPRHVLMANHYKRSHGSEVVFHDGNGKRVVRQLVNSMNVSDSYFPDIAVGILDEPVDLKFYRVLPPREDYHFYLRNALLLVADQHRRLYIHEIEEVRNMIGFAHRYDLPETYRKHLAPGDSGHPSFIVFNGEPVLVSANTFGGSGGGGFLSWTSNFHKVNAAMEALGGNEQLTVVTMGIR